MRRRTQHVGQPFHQGGRSCIGSGRDQPPQRSIIGRKRTISCRASSQPPLAIFAPSLPSAPAAARAGRRGRSPYLERCWSHRRIPWRAIRLLRDLMRRAWGPALHRFAKLGTLDRVRNGRMLGQHGVRSINHDHDGNPSFVDASRRCAPLQDRRCGGTTRSRTQRTPATVFVRDRRQTSSPAPRRQKLQRGLPETAWPTAHVSAS